ncbi:MAG: ribonuclease HI family protein [Acidobacteriaceae bacterium]
MVLTFTILLLRFLQLIYNARLKTGELVLRFEPQPCAETAWADRTRRNIVRRNMRSKSLGKEIGGYYLTDDLQGQEIIEIIPRNTMSFVDSVGRTIRKGRIKVENMQIIASFDGACEPFNPGGHMGIGWVIDGKSYSDYIPAAHENTNNVAEYLALTRILTHIALERPDATSLVITGDSQLVCFQLVGEYAVRSAHVYPHYQRAAQLIAALRNRGCEVHISWAARERNTEADAASKKALIDHDVTVCQRHPSAGYSSRLGDIADDLGISAIQLGRLLDQSGLRADKQPTQRALVAGVAVIRFDGYGPAVDWHVEKTLNHIQQDDSLASTLDAAQGKQHKREAASVRREMRIRNEAKRMDIRRSEIERLRKEVKRILAEDSALTLMDAVELVTDDVEARVEAFDAACGWVKHVKFVMPRVPIIDKVVDRDALNALLTRERELLVRRTIDHPGGISSAAIA